MHICSALVWLLAQENPVASGFAVVKVEVEEEKWIMGGLLVALRVFTCHIMWWVSMQNHHGTTDIHFVCLLYNCVWVLVWKGCSDSLGFPEPLHFLTHSVESFINLRPN